MNSDWLNFAVLRPLTPPQVLLPGSETEQSEPVCRAQWLYAASSASGNTQLTTHTPEPEPGSPLQTDRYRQTGMTDNNDYY